MEERQKIRLQKVLAERGVASRRAAEVLIVEGKVKVNGQVITELGTKVDPDIDRIIIDGHKLPEKSKLRYILLYKPAGWITSVKDERGRRTVIDLLDGIKERIYPVGRLDYDTSGLLLLTNDGELTNKLLHPAKEVDKTYQALVEGDVTKDKLNNLRNGVMLDDGFTAPAKVKLLRKKDSKSMLELTIHEGKNRQVRRMLAVVDLKCFHLKRVRFAFLTLDNLRMGEWRELTPEEVIKLKQ